MEVFVHALSAMVNMKAAQALGITRFARLFVCGKNVNGTKMLLVSRDLGMFHGSIYVQTRSVNRIV